MFSGCRKYLYCGEDELFLTAKYLYHNIFDLSRKNKNYFIFFEIFFRSNIFAWCRLSIAKQKYKCQEKIKLF